MEAILKAIKKQKIPIKPSVIISNKPDARGLKIAAKLGVKTEVVESKSFKGSRTDYDKKIISKLVENGVTQRNGIVCLAGFMRIISPYFIKKYRNRILNIHPSLLPAYPGLNAQKKALENGTKYSGCTVHFVEEGVDSGPILLQAIVKVNYSDTEDKLSKRILSKEHKIYPHAVNLVARKKIRIVGRRVKILS
jgi:phosphoribosylglycinamide formyltransferase-1